MAQPYVGEIRIFAGNFAPAGWMFCEGQLLPISENETLFQLIGTTYGGDGQETFGLPDMQGRLPVGTGQGSGLQNYLLGQSGGVEEVTLTINQIPNHTHGLQVTGNIAGQTSPGNNIYGQSAQAQMFYDGNPNVNMAATAVQPTGGSQPHENFQPYLCVDFIISLFGIFPSQT